MDTRTTLGDIAKEAGETWPAIYRRWSAKLELTIDVLDYGFRAQNQLYPSVDFESHAPREVHAEAVRSGPCYYNPHTMVLMGNFMGESIRTPDLLAIVREHAVEPRVVMVEAVVSVSVRYCLVGSTNRPPALGRYAAHT